MQGFYIGFCIGFFQPPFEGRYDLLLMRKQTFSSASGRPTLADRLGDHRNDYTFADVTIHQNRPNYIMSGFGFIIWIESVYRREYVASDIERLDAG